MKQQRTIKERILLFILQIILGIIFLIGLVWVFHFIGNGILSLSFEPEILCYPRDQIGTSIICANYNDFVFEYIGQTCIGCGMLIVFGLFIFGGYYGIKYLWDLTR